MAGTSIKFNNFELQNSDKYLITNIDHRMLPQREVIDYANPRRSSVTVVDSFFSQKEIVVEGRVVGDTEQELTTNINTLKKNLLDNEGNLDIEYGGNGEYLRYKATVNSFTVEESHYNTTRLPFTINFTSRPYGTDLTSQTGSATITSSPYSGSIDVGGSFGPFPIISWEVVSGTITRIKFTNTDSGDWIEFDTISLEDGDIITVNCEDRTIDINGATTDFNGVFPKFVPDVNNYEVEVVEDTESDFEVTQEIEYYETFL